MFQITGFAVFDREPGDFLILVHFRSADCPSYVFAGPCYKISEIFILDRYVEGGCNK